MTDHQTAVSPRLDGIVPYFTVNRLRETTAYNVTYVLIAMALVAPGSLRQLAADNAVVLAAAFGGLMFTKMQASVADVLHDYEADKRNDEKSHLARSVDRIGEEQLRSVLVLELTIGLVLWTWLSVVSDSMLYVAIGAISTVLGYTYSYPPRIKELGIFNHIMTSVGEVFAAIIPVYLLLGGTVDGHFAVASVIIVLYVFGYHITHQAADTYADRKVGMSTFTRQLGVERSMQLVILLTGLAAAVCVATGYYVTAVGLVVATGLYARIYREMAGQSLQRQCERIAANFEISRWAAAMNGVFFLDLVLSAVLLG